MLGHISKFDGNNSLIKHGVVQGNNIVDFDLLRNFNGGPGLNRENFIYISNIFFKYKTTERKKSFNKYVS
ncbi:hypothetical protein EC09BKT78844_5424 [Escherichia coli 09BKT078844]|nr:hypothetical protein EC09BKT78844_5424 [Escherichia coli 09BKT078844]OXL46957.1 hypothetical protein CD786_21525 [Escherichia coli O157:H7]